PRPRVRLVREPRVLDPGRRPAARREGLEPDRVPGHPEAAAAASTSLDQPAPGPSRCVDPHPLQGDHRHGQRGECGRWGHRRLRGVADPHDRRGPRHPRGAAVADRQASGAGREGRLPNDCGRPRGAWRTRRAVTWIARPAALVALFVAACAAPAAASGGARRYLNIGHDGHCPTYAGSEICSGEIPSFDGSKMDVDVTRPGGPRPRHGYPLVVMVHGAAGVDGSKREFESVNDAANGAERYRWNSHWFARHGFYVLTFTQRGYRTDPPVAPYQPDTPSGTSIEFPNGTIHLTSREFSLRDTKWLAAQVAKTFDVDRRRVVITGRNSGGGEAWMLAAKRLWLDPHRRDHSLPVLHLRA